MLCVICEMVNSGVKYHTACHRNMQTFQFSSIKCHNIIIQFSIEHFGSET